MSDNKTKLTQTSVSDFIEAIEHNGKREDAKVLDAIFRRVTGEEPAMWGDVLIGYGAYHYKYETGREGDFLRTGFSPRKAKHSIHLMGAYCSEEAKAETERLLPTLGKHSLGKSCLYVNKLADVDLGVLEQLIAISFMAMNEVYPENGR